MAGREPVAIVAVVVRTTDGRTTGELRQCLFDGVAWAERAGTAVAAEPLWNAVEEAVGTTRLPTQGTVVVGTGAGRVVERLAVAGHPTTALTVGSGAGGAAVSGASALEAAVLAFDTGGVRAAVVAVVDPVVPELAVVLVLKRPADARQDGDLVSALVEDRDGPPDLVVGRQPDEGAAGFDVAAIAGAHAAADLFAVACAALAVGHRAVPRPGAPARPWLGGRTAEVVTATGRVRLRSADVVPWVVGAPVDLRVYSGSDRDEVLSALAAGRSADSGPARLVVWSTEGRPLRDVEEAAGRWLSGGGPRPDNAVYRDSPLIGEVAFVFGNGAAAYRGMGADLLLAFPDLVTDLEDRYGPVQDLLDRTPGADSTLPWALRQIWGAGALAGLHRQVTGRLLGIRPDAVLGYSSGEMTAMVTMDVWRHPAEAMLRVRESWLYTSGVVGEFQVLHEAWRRGGVPGESWACHLVHASADRVQHALAGERAAHLMLVNAPESCVIGGDATACARVTARLGAGVGWEIDYPIVAHVPELAGVREQLRQLYHHPTAEVGGTRFYSCATTGWYHPTPETVADALTTQLLGTADFAGTVRRAWQDGVRVFVEHGPRGLCSEWVQQVLEGRDHLAVALDAPRTGGVRHLVRVVAELLAAGVRVDVDALLQRLSPRSRRPVEADSAASPPPAVPVAHHALLAGLHQEHVEREGVVHRTFLDLRAQVDAVLRGGGTTAVVDRLPDPPREAVVAAPATAPLAVVRPAAVWPIVDPANGDSPRVPEAAAGPVLDREQLERHAAGRVSELFGPLFAAQDGFRRQTRLPQPPVLLVDRVVALDAEPASMGRGVIRTETDPRLDDWYVDPTGRVAPALLTELGQGNILLMSWLGVDLRTGGERAYRVLSCELTYHGSPPVAGETVEFETAVESFIEHDGLLLAAFRADCRVAGQPRLTVRDARAGFFTEAELAGGEGVGWRPEDEDYPVQGPVDPPVRRSTRTRFGPEEVRALAGGRPVDCFGPGWRETRAHVRTPRIADGKLLILDEVPRLEFEGGPWGRGHLRAESALAEDEWFFSGHFEGDPCMPGSLMLQGCLQAMAFYLTATGCTLERDGWRFEPVPDRPVRLTCRTQATPRNHRVSYEVFVREFSTGSRPTLIADVLCSVDGVGALHGRGLGLRLVPDWPLSLPHSRPSALERSAGSATRRDDRPVAEVDGFRFDHASLLACAWGRPSEAFGPSSAELDEAERIAPRCPGPPYHFMSRIAAVTGTMGGRRPGGVVEVEYDVPNEAWFFDQDDSGVMPFAVMLEAALQPCGWLAAYTGGFDPVRKFRNLDGTATVLASVRPGASVLRTRAEMTGSATSGATTIQKFEVTCRLGEVTVLTMSTVFGFFPPAAFVGQAGLPVTEAERAALGRTSGYRRELRTARADHRVGEPRLSGDMLLMLDRITGYWPEGGRAGLGRVRGEKEIDPGEWFFRAHFFQDPVQPGSLGLEAMGQLLRWYAVERRLTAGFARPRFEPVALGRPVNWKYRGQVLPTDRVVTVEAEVLRIDEGVHIGLVVAATRLWVDDRCIYEAEQALRVVEG